MDDGESRFPNIPKRIAGLGELAYNLWWSWHPAARALFKALDRPAWKESGHNPVKMLRELPSERLNEQAQDIDYVRHIDAVLSRFHKDVRAKRGRFYDVVPGSAYLPIVYFSAEYGLHHSLPFYAGGLGFLAGDYLKE